MPPTPLLTTSPESYLPVIFICVVFARIPEIMLIVIGSGLHSVQILSAITLLTVLLRGQIQGAIYSKVGACLFGFSAWLCICVPFSVWRGGSVQALREWLISIVAFVIAAAAVNGIDECRRAMYAIAAGTVFIELVSLGLGRIQGGRMAMVAGTLGNANYLAMILLMGLPFCVLVLRARHGSRLFRAACRLALLLVPLTIVRTGSRGGLLALAVMFAFYFFSLPSSQKILAAAAVVLLAFMAVLWAPGGALDRYKSVFAGSSGRVYSQAEQSARESSQLRKELFLASLRLTVRHPIFGVGPRMFAVANGQAAENAAGQPVFNAWHETHNTFTEISSEDGIPGLLFYCAALLSAFGILRRIRRATRENPELELAAHMAFSLRLSLIAFVGTGIFASNAYAYYFPMLAGLCVAFERAVFSRTQPLPSAAPAIRPPAPAPRFAHLPWRQPGAVGPQPATGGYGATRPEAARSSGSGAVRR